MATNTGIQLKIEPFGFKQAEGVIRAIIAKGKTLRIPFSAFGRYLVGRTHEYFSKEEGPDGKPWKALTQHYIDRPRKQHGRGGEAHPILFYPGRGYLEGSITYHASDDALAFGTNRKFPVGEYSAAAIHQLGGLSSMAPGPAAIPARPFLGLTREDNERGGELLGKYLESL